MTQERVTPKSGESKTTYQKVVAGSYYALLGLHPSASVREIRQTYRDLSKLYHPDTTTLPTEIATAKFQQLNEAYATLSNPERRNAYDRKIGYSSVPVVNPLPSLSRLSTPYRSSSAYLDPTDRPLSPGEIFALFILGVTFICCLVLAIAIGLTRGESSLQTVTGPSTSQPEVNSAIVAKPSKPLDQSYRGSQPSGIKSTIRVKPSFDTINQSQSSEAHSTQKSSATSPLTPSITSQPQSNLRLDKQSDPKIGDESKEISL